VTLCETKHELGDERNKSDICNSYYNDGKCLERGHTEEASINKSIFDYYYTHRQEVTYRNLVGNNANDQSNQGPVGQRASCSYLSIDSAQDGSP